MIPNILTVLRFIFSFLLFYLIYNRSSLVLILILFIVILISDFLDGFIARKYNMVTSFGKLADPIADRTFVILVTLSLLLNKLLPLYSLFIFVRDFIVAIVGYYIMVKKKRVIGSDIFGKIKTVLHFFSLGFVILFDSWNNISLILLIIGFLIIIPEGIYVYRKYIKEV